MYCNRSNRRRAAPARGFMARCAVLLAYSVVGAVSTVPSTPAHAQSFSGLGFLTGGNASVAVGVNADGTVVVGDIEGTSYVEAFRWTQAGGMAGLGFLPGGGFSEAVGVVNADGRTLSKDASRKQPRSPARAIRPASPRNCGRMASKRRKLRRCAATRPMTARSRSWANCCAKTPPAYLSCGTSWWA
jgi:probable HAF family extracellular repeat protein